ncbi:MAG TPA: hypothetical protein VL523_20400 [Terriglobia bacterium]|nr:hypothetical protein [Terriglobia bacterium]
MKHEPQYSILTVVALVLLGLAALTLAPHAASKPDVLGFRTLCAFAPLSTVILLTLAGFVRVMRDVVYKRDERR